MNSPIPVQYMNSGRIAPFMAVIDQSVYSLISLALQIIIARSVSSEQFGAYTVANAFFFVASLVHQALIIEPMFVYSTQRYAHRMVAYHAQLRKEWSIGFAIATSLLGLCIAAGFLFLGSSLVAENVAAYSLISPIVLYLSLLRRIAFIVRRIDLSVFGGMVYAFSLCITAGLTSFLGDMTAVVGISLSGAAALIASLAVSLLLPRPRATTLPPSDMLHQHVRYGRWAIGSESVNWLIVNGPTLLLPIWFGLSAAGQFRVLFLVFMPLHQLVSAMCSILLRRYANCRHEAEDFSIVLRFFSLLLLGASTYALFFVLLGPVIIPIIFGADYVVKEQWLVLAACANTFLAATQGFFVALRAREQSHQILLVYVSVLAILVCLLPLVASLGIPGLLFAQTTGWGLAIPLAGVLAARPVASVREPLQRGRNVSRAALFKEPRTDAK
jgi:O-antigen/teichoic acid export membrane protein